MLGVTPLAGWRIAFGRARKPWEGDSAGNPRPIPSRWLESRATANNFLLGEVPRLYVWDQEPRCVSPRVPLWLVAYPHRTGTGSGGFDRPRAFADRIALWSQPRQRPPLRRRCPVGARRFFARLLAPRAPGGSRGSDQSSAIRLAIPSPVNRRDSTTNAPLKSTTYRQPTWSRPLQW